jgi:serine/threonine protein kinase
MDIWSIGVIMFEVLTGKAFFPLESSRDAMKDSLLGLEPLPVEEDPRVFQRIPAEGNLRNTVKSMLSRDTNRRPTALEVRLVTLGSFPLMNSSAFTSATLIVCCLCSD